MNLEDILLIGTRAAQPAALSVAEGILYSVTDEDNLVEQSRGGAWITYAGAGAGGGGSSSFSGGGIPFPLPIDGEDGEDGFRGPIGLTGPAGSSPAGGAGWTLVDSIAASGAATRELVSANIDNYAELLVLAVLVSTDVNTSIRIRVTVDGGSNWLSASGDYKTISNTDGTETNITEINMSSGITTAVRTAFAIISNSNGTTNPKIVQLMSLLAAHRIPTTSPINGIQFKVGNVGTTLFTGGTFYVFGR